MRYLLIGGAGFLGQALTKKILKGRGNKVHIIDNFSFSDDPSTFKINKRIGVSYGDAASQLSIQSAINKFQPEIIIHLAAFHAFNPGSDQRIETARITQGLLPTISFLARLKPKLFIYTSADFVYDEIVGGKLNELGPIKWGTPDTHAMQKIIGEWYSITNCTRYRIPIVILRPSYIIGDRKYANHFVDPIIFIIDNLLTGRPFILIRPDQKKDYIHVDNAVDMIFNIIKSDKYNTVYNISSGIGVSNLELFKMIENIIEPKNKSKIIASSSADVVLPNEKVLTLGDINLEKINEVLPNIIKFRKDLRS